jgi:uncharacterized membrane protein YidH (DUF202 family)
MATMVAISIWELPVAAMMTLLLMQRHLPMRPLLSWPRIRLTLTVGVMAAAAYLFYLPFYLNFVAPPSGVGFKFASTSLQEFLIVFGALLAAPALFLAADAGPKLSVGPELQQLLGALLALLVVIAYLAGNAVFVSCWPCWRRRWWRPTVPTMPIGVHRFSWRSVPRSRCSLASWSTSRIHTATSCTG